MATAECRSAGKTFSMARCSMEFPAVARRSPAMTTPPSKRMDSTVVPWGTSTRVGLAWAEGDEALTIEEGGEIGPRVLGDGEERERHYWPPFCT